MRKKKSISENPTSLMETAKMLLSVWLRVNNIDDAECARLAANIAYRADPKNHLLITRGPKKGQHIKISQEAIVINNLKRMLAGKMEKKILEIQKRELAKLPPPTFTEKMRVTYIPNHANGDKNHKDVEHGTVTSVNYRGQTVCRVFVKFDDKIRKLGWNGCTAQGCDPTDLIPHVIPLPL